MIALGPLIIGAPWGLAALAGIPAVLAIHWFRLRSPPRPVTALFLWPPPAPAAAGGRRRDRLRNLPSLWLELFAVAVLAAWLADLHPAGDDRGRHLVIVLDDRRRLQAHLPGSGTPADRLRDDLRARFAALAGDDRVTVIASGATPRLLAGPAAEVAQARAAVDRWSPAGAWHDLDAALAFAGQLAGPATGGASVLLASDRLPPSDSAPGIAAIARGRALATTGLADVRWVREGAAERLVVGSAGDAPPRPREIRAAGAVIARVSGTPGTHLLPLPRDPPESLGVALVGDDPLPADDQATVRRPARRAVRVAIDLPDPTGAAVRAVVAALPDIEPPGVAPDLLVGTADSAEPGAWVLRIAPGGGDASLGPFLVRRGHPLCRDLDGSGLLWVGGLPLTDLAPGSVPLMSAGDTVLLAETRRGRDRRIDAWVDPARGTLLHHPLWPALLANVIEARRAALPGVTAPTVAVGQPVPVVLPVGTASVVLRGPDGAEAPVVADADGRALLPALDRAGTWTLLTAGGPWLTLEAVDLDQRLADLAAAADGERAAPPTEAVAVARRRSPAALLLPLVLAALAAFGAWWFGGRGR